MLVLHRPIGAAVYPAAQHDPALAAALQASLAEQQRHSAATAPDSRMRAALVESLEVQSLMAAAAPLACWNHQMIAIFHETKRPVLDAYRSIHTGPVAQGRAERLILAAR